MSTSVEQDPSPTGQSLSVTPAPAPSTSSPSSAQASVNLSQVLSSAEAAYEALAARPDASSPQNVARLAHLQKVITFLLDQGVPRMSARQAKQDQGKQSAAAWAEERKQLLEWVSKLEQSVEREVKMRAALAAKHQEEKQQLLKTYDSWRRQNEALAEEVSALQSKLKETQDEVGQLRAAASSAPTLAARSASLAPPANGEADGGGREDSFASMSDGAEAARAAGVDTTVDMTLNTTDGGWSEEAFLVTATSMREHPEDEEVQAEGCSILEALLDVEPSEAQHALRQLEADPALGVDEFVAVVLRALAAFRDNWKVRSFGCSTLAHLCRVRPATTHTVLRSSVGAMSLLIDLMARADRQALVEGTADAAEVHAAPARLLALLSSGREGPAAGAAGGGPSSSGPAAPSPALAAARAEGGASQSPAAPLTALSSHESLHSLRAATPRDDVLSPASVVTPGSTGPGSGAAGAAGEEGVPSIASQYNARYIASLVASLQRAAAPGSLTSSLDEEQDCLRDLVKTAHDRIGVQALLRAEGGAAVVAAMVHRPEDAVVQGKGLRLLQRIVALAPPQDDHKPNQEQILACALQAARRHGRDADIQKDFRATLALLVRSPAIKAKALDQGVLEVLASSGGGGGLEAGAGAPGQDPGARLDRLLASSPEAPPARGPPPAAAPEPSAPATPAPPPAPASPSPPPAATPLTPAAVETEARPRVQSDDEKPVAVPPKPDVRFTPPSAAVPKPPAQNSPIAAAATSPAGNKKSAKAWYKKLFSSKSKSSKSKAQANGANGSGSPGPR